MPEIEPHGLRRLAERILCAAGMQLEDAVVTAECLVMANLRGVDTHGVFRLAQHVETLRKGEVNASPHIRVVARHGATALIDADGGYGFRPSLLAVEVAVEMASSMGAGIAGVRNSHHFGMAAIYTMRASQAGAIGIITTTSFPLLPPPGGARPVVGNNPISCAVPRRPPLPPIVLDMALSEVAFGRIRMAAIEGKAIPIGWAYDSNGRATSDPVEALASKMLAPVGQHKGYGLSVIAEVLAGVLTGSPFGMGSDAHSHRQGGVGHLVIAINPSYFIEVSRFYDQLEQLVAQKAVPVAGADGVYLPGEPEWNRSMVRQAEGIPVSDELAKQLTALAEEMNLERPSWL